MGTNDVRLDDVAVAMAALERFECMGCGAALHPDYHRGYIECEYCGGTYGNPEQPQNQFNNFGIMQNFHGQASFSSMATSYSCNTSYAMSRGNYGY